MVTPYTIDGPFQKSRNNHKTLMWILCYVGCVFKPNNISIGFMVPVFWNSIGDVRISNLKYWLATLMCTSNSTALKCELLKIGRHKWLNGYMLDGLILHYFALWVSHMITVVYKYNLHMKSHLQSLSAILLSG